MDINDIKNKLNNIKDNTGWSIQKELVKIIVDVIEVLTTTVKEFDDTSSILILKITKTIERFEASSTKAANRMFWLTCVIAGLTVVIAILTVVMISQN